MEWRNLRKTSHWLAASFLAGAILAGAAEHQTLTAAARREAPLGLDAYMPIPEDNPLTPEKVKLGRKLFHDRLLSRDRSISCATCHNPKSAFTDGQAIARGVLGRKGSRSAPTLINRGYGTAFFWDGRAASLEEQVLQPIQNPNEMDMTIQEAVARLKHQRGYRKHFQAAFAREVNSEGLALALASYTRSILSGDAPIDRYLNGEREALSPEARRGLGIFRGKANCTACHVGPNFTDERFHNTGVAWRDGQVHDQGRFAITGKESDRGAFKTPTLREVARTGPYMHDGSFETLQDVIEFYDGGGRPNPYFDAELGPLHLSPEEKQALLAFLKALTGSIHEGPSVSRAK